MQRRFALALALGLTLAAPAASRGQDLPKADDLLDKYIEVTGGKAAYEKVKNRITKGSLEIAGAGVKGTLTIFQAAPAQMLTRVDFEQLGRTSQGVIDGIAFEQSPITGDRILTGDEKATALRTARFDAEVNWREIYPKVETTGVEEIDGKPAYKVVLTPKEGSPTTNYYDKESGLVVRSDSTIKSPMGEIPIMTYLSDYKKTEGLLMPMKTRQKVLTQEIVITIEDVKQNVEMPKDALTLPEDIKALAAKKAK